MPRPVAAALVAGLLLALTGCAAASGADPEPAGSCHSNAGAAPTAAERAAERLAMPQQRFWHLIDVLHRSNSDAAYARLSRALEPLPTDDVEAFQIRMTLALHQLDDECRADWYADHDPSGTGMVADDDFLCFRADTVSAGRAVWTEAVRTDTLPWGSTDAAHGDGENLLYAADVAVDHRGGSSDAFETAVTSAIGIDYETGSNPAGWAPTSTDDS